MVFNYNELILGDKTDAFLRRLAINLAIIGFVVHLLACVLYKFNYLDMSDTNDFFDSYLDSLYTPFSIILAYDCLLYTSPSPRDSCASRMPSSA